MFTKGQPILPRMQRHQVNEYKLLSFINSLLAYTAASTGEKCGLTPVNSKNTSTLVSREALMLRKLLYITSRAQIVKNIIFSPQGPV